MLGRLCEQAEIRAAQLRPRLADLRSMARHTAAVPALTNVLSAKATVQVIAEIKRSSPSKGIIDASIDGPARAREYEAGGAAAISVLTEPNSFGGSLADLLAIRESVAIPLLKKDFHVDPAQIWEARVAGASAVLVIVRAVGPAGTKRLAQAAHDSGIEAVFEIRDEQELEWALQVGARLIGVNRRNLETLDLDDDVPRRVLPLIPASCIAIAESGISGRAAVSDAAGLGANAVLVGTSLSASSDPSATLRELLGVPRCERRAHG